MEKLQDKTLESCRDFVARVASSEPAPGGGGAAALVGAVGTALGNMVGSLTAGKKKYAAVEAEIQALMDQCQALEVQLLDQVAADEAGFLPLAKAYGIPKDDPTRLEIFRAGDGGGLRRPDADHAPLLPGHRRHCRLCGEGLPPGCFRCRVRRGLLQGGAAGGVAERLYQHEDAARPRLRRRNCNAQCFAMLREYGQKADSIYDAVQKSFFPEA